MHTILHVSKSVTQELVNELYEIGVVEEFTNRSIDKVLKEHNCDIDNSVLTVVRKNNPLSLLSKTGPFDSDYKRSLFFRNNFLVIVEWNIF